MNTLELEVDGHVGWLRLDRPDKLNSFTIEMWRELGELGEHLLADPGEIRALVVIGKGRAFSSGIDTSVFGESIADGGDALAGAAETGARHADPVVDTIMRTAASYTWLERVPFATIAAIRGYAFGAGLQLALACDVRLVARGTQLGLLEFKYGIIPDLGGTQRLPRLVGPGKAKELIFTAAKIDAEESCRIGLAEHLVDDSGLERRASELASTIAAQPPLAVRSAKRAVQAAVDGSTDEGLRIEAEGQAVCIRSDDMKEAVAAFVEQRRPEYRGR